MHDVSGPVAITAYSGLLTIILGAVGGVIKHYVTERFKRLDREIERFEQQKKEAAQSAAAFAVLRAELEMAKAHRAAAEQQRDEALRQAAAAVRAELELRKQDTGTRMGLPSRKERDARSLYPRVRPAVDPRVPGPDDDRPGRVHAADHHARPKNRKEDG